MSSYPAGVLVCATIVFVAGIIAWVVVEVNDAKCKKTVDMYEIEQQKPTYDIKEVDRQSAQDFMKWYAAQDVWLGDAPSDKYQGAVVDAYIRETYYADGAKNG